MQPDHILLSIPGLYPPEPSLLHMLEGRGGGEVCGLKLAEGLGGED